MSAGEEETAGDWSLMTEEEVKEEEQSQEEMATKRQEYERNIQAHTEWKYEILNVSVA